MSEQALPHAERAVRPALLTPQELAVAVLLVLEVGVFSVVGTNFLTHGNALEVVRLSVEIGLLALAMTPVIVTGGIDLSAGSLLGLSAVVFGKLWRDVGVPWEAAVLATLVLGAAAGALNALLITRLRLPPLIVTLGTFSLFRGLAEGLTTGEDNFTGFPREFLYLGQGYLLGVVPAQLPILVAAAGGFWLLLQRSSVGRALYAIGFSPEGARHAGLPVGRRLGLVYIVSGAVASLAGLVYAAHNGQARADAGLGAELLAITAVVLGGTSIFGGRGTIHGTLLGLFTIAVLQNGLHLADQPAELAGVLTGVLLLAAILFDRLSTRAGATSPTHEVQGELHVKNWHVAVLSGVILAAALIVASSNWLLVQAVKQAASSRGPGTLPADGNNPGGGKLTIAMMPKSKGNAYFRACQKGADEAAKELGVELLWDGPTDPDPARQNEFVEAWITRGVDVIAVAVENREGLAPVLKKARDKGIVVVTWDADTTPDAREFFVNQASNEAIGQTLMDHAARIMNNKGEFAIISATLTASNMIEWQKQIRARKEKYPEIQLVDVRPCDDKQPVAYEKAKTLLNEYPNLKLIMAICSPAVPGAAEAVESSEHKDVKVIGLGLPSQNKRFVHKGITECVVLWKTQDLGYLTVQAAVALKRGTLKPGDREFQSGRLNKVQIAGDNILLGPPFTFTKENIDQFDF